MPHRQSADLPRFMPPDQVSQAVFTLDGLLSGLNADGVVEADELAVLRGWFEEYRPLCQRHPFSELVPMLQGALADGRLQQDELCDLQWLCSQLAGEQSLLTVAEEDMARLRGILRGILADGRISVDELQTLRQWIGEREHLRRCWPYDEIESLVFAVLQDGVIDSREQAELTAYFDLFTASPSESVAAALPAAENIAGVCALAPEIELAGNTFCFAGQFSRYTRDELVELVRNSGGRVADQISSCVDYLVVGSDGNPCWTYACYGRRVQQAMQLRQQGAQLLLVHEFDFCDAVEFSLQ